MKTKQEDNELILELQLLTSQLEQTRIQQELIEKKLAKVWNQLHTKEAISTTIDDSFVSQPKYQSNKQTCFKRLRKETVTSKVKFTEEPLYTSDNIPEVGDSVRIINPKPGQCDRGIVKEFCRDGKVKVVTAAGSTITRKPKKLRKEGSLTINVNWLPLTGSQTREFSLLFMRSKDLIL